MIFRPLCVAITFALSYPALAQTPPTADTIEATDLDRIQVIGTRERGYRPTVATTANKTETPIKETPFSIQVVTRELIEDRGVTTFGEAVRTVPGLTPQVGWGGTNDRFRLRGFATPSNLKNGFRRNAFIPADELANVEQIEVLKGPASALYGRFEPGGVVNIVTKKPLPTQQNRIDLSHGRYGFARATLDSTGPLGENLGYRINAAYQDADSFRDRVYGRTEFVSPVLAWQIDDRSSLTVELEHLRKVSAFDRGFGNSVRFLEVPISTNYAGSDTRSTNTSRLGSLVYDHVLGNDWRLRLGASASEGETSAFWWAYAFPPIAFGTGAGPDPIVNRRAQFNYDRQRDRTLQAELDGVWNTGAVSHRLLFGIESSRDRWDFTGLAGPNRPTRLFAPEFGVDPGELLPSPSVGDSRNDATALYVQDEMTLGEQWRLLLGARHDRADVDATSGFFPPDVVQPIERRFSATSPRVGLTWTPMEAVSLYASWSRGFQNQIDSGVLRDGSVPDPAIGEQHEVGAKFRLLDGRFTPTVAWFDISRRDGVVSDPDDFNFLIQIGEQRGRGWEFDLPLVINEQWRVLASYTRLDASIVDEPGLSGNRLANAPQDNGSVWTTYDFAGTLRGFSVGAGAHYVGEREANNSNTFELPGYTRFDANLAYRFGANDRWRAQLNVQNLTDERYYDSGGSFVPMFPGAPRTWTATLGVSF